MEEEKVIPINVKVDEQSIMEFFDSLPRKVKLKFLDRIMWEDVITIAEEQLRGNTDFWSYDSTGWRNGSRLRDHIAKMTGIMECKLREVTRQRDQYKEYWDWKIYHYDNDVIKQSIRHTIGWIK